MSDSGLGITRETLLLIVPPALTHDPAMMARAAADAEALTARLAEIDRVRVMSNIDNLDEAVLDILAHDFKVDWWDPGYSLEQKRRTLKSSWQVHKALGTKGAVEKAASAVYPETRVQEWFEYGGRPYHFRLSVDLPEDGWTPERHKQLMWRLQYYKNLRSHLDRVTYQLPPVVLHNRQALWFSTMRILLGQENREQLALERLWLVMGMRQRKGQTVGLHLRSVVENRETAAFHKLFVRVRMNGCGLNPIRLNGARRLDGTWRLDQGVARPPALHAVTVTGMGVKNRRSVSAAATADTMWRLDGTFRLDGKKKLNAKIVRSEL